MFAGEYKGKPRREDFSSFSLPQERQNSRRMFVVPLGVCPSPGRLLPCCAPPGEVEGQCPSATGCHRTPPATPVRLPVQHSGSREQALKRGNGKILFLLH